MKVLAINGSARKDGNTDIMIGRIFETLEAAGIELEKVQFSGQVIEPCKACFSCGEKGNCTYKKDVFQEVFEKMVKCPVMLQMTKKHWPIWIILQKI
jgi:multimeric flavodoxin WrbA